ncbi:MAG: hypothetical protein ACREIP_19410, partial [Alphaproteobacteria bacterium]
MVGTTTRIDGRDVGSVIAQEGAPTLGRWPAALDHVLGDCRLGHLEAELWELAVNAWRSPQLIFFAHSTNQGTKFAIDPRPAHSA